MKIKQIHASNGCRDVTMSPVNHSIVTDSGYDELMSGFSQQLPPLAEENPHLKYRHTPYVPGVPFLK